MYLLVTVCALAQIGDPSIDDVKTFAHHDHETVKAKRQMAQFYSCYLGAQMLEAQRRGDNKLLGQLHREQHLHDFSTRDIYADLDRIKDSRKDDKVKLLALRHLHRLLGDTAYQTGVIPPPYPAKTEKEFKKWLDEQFKAGLKTPEKISEATATAYRTWRELQQKKAAAQRAKQEQLDREKQKEREKEKKRKEKETLPFWP